MNELMIIMILVLGLVIVGTYLFYKGSVSFVFNAIRKSKKGYLSINEVLSLSSIMFRMKSNALLLTIITTVSALAIGLLSLSYISYYSAEATAKESSPHDFGFARTEAKEKFIQALNKEQIKYKEIDIYPVGVDVDATQIMDVSPFTASEDRILSTSVVSDISIEGVELEPGETRLMGYSSALEKLITLKETGEVGFLTSSGTIKQQLSGVSKQPTLPVYYASGSGVFVVDESVYQELVKVLDPKLQKRKK